MIVLSGGCERAVRLSRQLGREGRTEKTGGDGAGLEQSAVPSRVRYGTRRRVGRRRTPTVATNGRGAARMEQ